MQESHPYRQQQDERHLHGPKAQKIAAAVDRRAVERGMCVAEIEELILAALLQWLSVEPDR